MSFQIICNVDHSPIGTKAGAVIFESLKNAADGQRALRIQRDYYPNCDLTLKDTAASEATK